MPVLLSPVIKLSREWWLAWALNRWGGAGILHMPTVLSSVEVKVSICGQRNLHIGEPGDHISKV
jgi:hypothetical protein